MSHCTEIAIFKVAKQNIERVIALSLQVFDEINANGPVIVAHKILKKDDDDEEICWQLTWINQEAVALTTKKWSSFKSTAELESLVGDKLYYGHFVDLNEQS